MKIKIKLEKTWNIIKNFYLITRFPFLELENRITRSNYDFTWLDIMETGWRKAFGIKMCKELKRALKKTKSLKKYVVIEVKLGKFKPEHLGQLIFYVNAIDELERTEVDNETIGLLLCKDADKFVAETTLKKSLMKLGISKYKTLEELPEYLEKKLNEEK
jgi:hypothetical protein